MKLLRYEQDWRSHWGILVGETVHALEGDPFGEARAGRAIGPLADLRLLAPCLPETIWSLGANYPSRCYERGFALPTQPSVAVCPGSLICGSGSDVRIPEFERRAEYGAEPGGVEGQVLHYGQTIEIEIEGVGRLVNRVTRVDTGAVTPVVSLERWLAQRGGR